MAVTLDPATLTSGSLSNGNLTITAPSSATYARARTAVGSTSKFYFEVVQTAGTGEYSSAVLILPPAATLADGTSEPIVPNSAVGFWLSGELLSGSSGYLAALVPAVAGNRICVAMDNTNRKIWLRIAAGSWNATVGGSQDPATNTGGHSLSAVTGFSSAGTLIKVGASVQWSRALDFDFASADWSHSAPSGFSALTDALAPPPPPSINPFLLANLVR